MGPDRDENNDGTDQLRYPSPTTEAVDSGPFYHTNGRDDLREQDNQPEPQDSIRDQVLEHDHANLHHTDQSDPQQHASRPPNLEELQLAAQLGHGLAGTSMLPSTDPNMGIDESSLRSILPQPEPEHHQHIQYLQDAPNAESMVPHSLPVNVPGTLQSHYGLNDNVPPRKRSKVSRACDECRRKKIKCDAQSDTGEAPCSSCARSSIRCLFSRVPQKRGPSKGYIKELADRIHSIENKLESEGGLTHEELTGLFGNDRPRPSATSDDANRKRPFSSISGGEFGAPARQPSWGSEPPAIQPAGPSDSHEVTPYSADALAPQPSPIQAGSVPPVLPTATMESLQGTADVPELDDDVVQDYLATVHSLYPILPVDRTRLESLLLSCPDTIRSAFINALLAVAQSSSGNVKLASALVHDWETSDTPQARVVNIVHAQTLLLLIIDADWRCSPSLPSLLARAVALANTMRLWQYTSLESAGEPDSDEHLCIRIWWSLVLMDRWHAVGTGQPVLIPSTSVVAPAGLEVVTGDLCFQLTRLSKLMTRISQVITFLPLGKTTADEHMAGILNDYIEDFRQSLPADVDPYSYPLVHLAYWHCKLFITLITPNVVYFEIAWPLQQLINLLSINADIRSPLVNHFGLLVVFALSKLSSSDESREEALKLNKEILDKPGGIWDSIRDKLLDQARPTSSGDAGSLQHLADLAAAHHEAGMGDESGHLLSLAGGYLQLS